MRAGRGCRPALFAHFAGSLRRGPCPCARPLRRGAPAAASRPRSGARRPPFASLRSPGPGLGPPPRLSRSATPTPGPLPRLRRALAGPGWFAPRHPLRCGLPSLRFGRPCFSPARRAPARGPAGSPPGPPASRLRARRLPAPGALRGPSGRFFWAPAPGALAARPRLRGLAGVRRGYCLSQCGSVPCGSPLRPPALPPPLGAPGSAGPKWGACGPPPPTAAAPPGPRPSRYRCPSAALPLYQAVKAKPFGLPAVGGQALTRLL